MKQNIEINIEELRLHGFSHIDRYRLGQSLQIELTRLFTERDIPTSFSRGNEVAQLDGGTFNITSSSNEKMIGLKVAHLVCDCIHSEINSTEKM